MPDEQPAGQPGGGGAGGGGGDQTGGDPGPIPTVPVIKTPPEPDLTKIQRRSEAGSEPSQASRSVPILDPADPGPIGTEAVIQEKPKA